MADDVNVKFGADIADLKDKVDDVMGMFGKITERFAALAAVVAGGEAFREVIKSFSDMEASAERMSRVLGITADEAQVLNVAIKEVGAQIGDGSLSAETYTGAFLKFNRQLRLNSDALRVYGVDVDAVSKGTKTSKQVFEEALAVVGKYKAGNDQAQVAMALFGRSVSDVNALLKVTPEVQEEARKKAQSLNLILSEEGVRSAQDYRTAMNDVHDVMEGMGATIAQAVMPHFTALAKQLADIGPQIVQGVGAAIQVVITLWDTFADVVSTAWGAIKGVLDALLGGFVNTFGVGAPNAMEIFKAAITVVQRAIVIFGTGLQETFNVIGTVLALAASRFRTLGEVAWAALHFDWSGIKQAWQDGTDRTNDILQKGIDKAVKIAQDGQTKLEGINIAALALPGGKAAGGPGTGGNTAPIGKNSAADLLKAQLALQTAALDAQRAIFLEYLKEQQSDLDEAYKNGLVSTKDYYDRTLAIEQAALDTSLQARKQELAQVADAIARASQKAAGAKPQDRVKAEAEVVMLQAKQQTLLGQIGVLEQQRAAAAKKTSDAYTDQTNKINQQLAAIASARDKATADANVQLLRDSIAQMQALRQVDNQTAFQMQKGAEDQSYAATLAFLAAKRAAITGTQDEIRVQQAQADADELAAKQQHEQRITQIEQQAEQDREKLRVQAQQSIEQGFASSLDSFLNGQKSLLSAFKSFLSSVVSAINNVVSQTIATKLLGAGTSGGNFFGSIIDGIMKGFAGGFATGGTIGAGQWGIVGENGPELITGGRGGGTMVLPNAMLNGALAAGGSSSPGSSSGIGGPSVTQNIAIHVQGPVDTRTQQQIYTGIGRAAQSALRRNGGSERPR